MLLIQLVSLRAKHAPRVLKLLRIALSAICELEQIADTVDDESCTLYNRFVRDIHD